MKYSDMDVFHELIVVDEVSRCGSGGVTWGLMGGLGIGLPPVLLFAEGTASKHCSRTNRVFLYGLICRLVSNPQAGPLRAKIARPCLAAEKFVCLAVTEPTVGSDVAQIKCSAKLNKEGTHYVVNGYRLVLSLCHSVPAVSPYCDD